MNPGASGAAREKPESNASRTPAAVSCGPGRQRVLAPNPGAMTLDGTNTWVIGEIGRDAPVIVDPGPADEDHLQTVLAAAGGSAAGVWITHRHDDHTDGAYRMGELAACPVRAMDPAHASAAELVLADGASYVIGDAWLSAIHTPGHTSDSMSFLLQRRDANVLLTGDTVLGRGTTVIAHPDGDLGAYLGSLDRLIGLVEDYRIEQILPGHGDPITEPAGVLTRYREHRMRRLAEVGAALDAGDRTAAEVVARVYAGVDPSVRAAAEQSVRAQLEYLGRNAR